MNGETITFGEVANMIRQTVQPKDTLGMPYIGLEHIEEGTLRLNSYGQVEDVMSAKFRFSQGDILFGKLRPYFRKVIRAPFDGVCSTDIWVVRAKDGIEQRYLYYLMASQDFVNFATQGSEGTKMPRAKWEHICRYEQTRLSYDEQRAIANILGTLDDKIELNRKMNETLEAMARAIFKSWFIDFDPVRAKVEGRSAGLPKEIADLFPDSFEKSELGEIPMGWKIGSLDDFAVLNPESWSNNTRPLIINYVDLSNTKWGHIEAITVYDSKNAPSRAQRVLRSGDTILGTVRPGNGSFALVIDDNLTGSTGFAVIRPRTPEAQEFVYLAATTVENIEALAHLADGGAYPAVRPEVVLATQVVRPWKQLITQFAHVAHPLLTKLAKNDQESRTLAAIRDTLLPKILSGEIRIKDVERFAEVAAIKSEVIDETSPKPGKRKAPDEFREAVLISALVRALSTNQYPLGRMRYTKISYLIHRKLGHAVEQKYLKKAAGPYSPWPKYKGPERIAIKNGYIKQSQNGVLNGFCIGPQISRIDQYLERYDFKDVIGWATHNFKKMTNDRLELLSTVDFAVRELESKGKQINSATVRALINAEPEWAPKLNRAIFSEMNIQGVLHVLSGYFPEIRKGGSS